MGKVHVITQDDVEILYDDRLRWYIEVFDGEKLKRYKPLELYAKNRDRSTINGRPYNSGLNCCKQLRSKILQRGEVPPELCKEVTGLWLG